MTENRAKFTIAGQGIIFNEQGQILLVHRTDYDLWNLPGGCVEADEAPWEGALREVKEETGFDTEIVQLLGVYNKPNQDDIVFTFLCKVTGGQATLNDEADKIEYFNIDEMPKNTSPMQIERIKDAINELNQVTLGTQKGKSSFELISEGLL